jgi:diguanylate cyclase (GGDEF)-like protein/putative nucleotidyltransferase with HDIG domain
MALRFMAPKTFSTLPKVHQTYVGAVIIVGAVTVALSLHDFLVGSIPKEWLFLAALTLASGSATIQLHSVPVALSISETFVFTSAILFGPSAGALTVALDAAVISFWSFKKGQPLFKIAFNICALPLTIWLSSHLFFAVAGFEPLFTHRQSVQLQGLLGPLLLFTVVYFLLSTWIITLAITLERQLRPVKIWWENFAWLSLNYFGGASVAALVVSYTNDFDYRFLIIIVPLLPLLAILYATYSRKVARFEDANRHLTELNALYMSTIETLAMAIDAKDQVTHGHIRRVQQYAVGLAQYIGVKDPGLIRAIEAAALLHDMGKLAIPEYILNKPGPLTKAEFERIKLHATVGADILSSINFPYPVVPIVRHHHESWDGSGYPKGLKETEIPVGARILAVVDCYDALTSDRPYRPRLPEADAIRILLERRGSMYDPLIVDKFLEICDRLVVDAPESRTRSEIELVSIAPGGSVKPMVPPPATGLDDIAASTEEMLALYDLAQGLMGQIAFADAADVIAKHLRRLVPASSCVFFLYDSETDELVTAHASGEGAPQFAELRIPRGQRLTGWVAASRQTILNSDPILDLGDAARHFKPRLRSCLSTPLLADNQLVGVLTVYSPLVSAFTEDHQRLIDVVARQVSHTVKHAREFEQQSAIQLKDKLTGLLSRERVQRFVTSEIGLASSNAVLSVLLIDIPGLGDAERPQGRTSWAAILAGMVTGIKSSLRGADILFRYSNDQLVVLLTQTDQFAATSVANRIVETLAESTSQLSGAALPTLGIASAPADGTTLDELVSAAQTRRRLLAAKMANRPPAIH